MTDTTGLTYDQPMNVQYIPCGHVSSMVRSQLAEELDKLDPSSLLVGLAGTDQLGQIDAGMKLDAAILHSASCADCQYDREKSELEYASYDL